MALKGSKTEQNLKDAFAGESQANRRYLYFAGKADIEGQNDVAARPATRSIGKTPCSMTRRPAKRSWNASSKSATAAGVA
jgi:hypothetical protein